MTETQPKTFCQFLQDNEEIPMQPEPSPQPSPCKACDKPPLWPVSPPRPCQRTLYPELGLRVAIPELGELGFRSAVRGVDGSPLSCQVASVGLADHMDVELRCIAGEAVDGFVAGVGPVLEQACTGGTYFLRSPTRKIVGVFKPSDEEPYAPNNPKEFAPASMGDGQEDGLEKKELRIKSGVPVGGSAAREFAVFLLDQESRLAGVPATSMAAVEHPQFASPKHGSLQAYMPHFCNAEDMGPSLFPLPDVQAIAMLDIRTINQDRHSGNVLVCRESPNGSFSSNVNTNLSASVDSFLAPTRPSLVRGASLDDVTGPTTERQQTRLVPIDHGMCLPECDSLEDTTFCWMSWPQAKSPIDRKLLGVIELLDSYADAAMIREVVGNEAISEQSMLSLHIGTLVLQRGASAGLSLFEIGSLFVRDDLDEPCVVEKIVACTRLATHEDASTEEFMQAFEELIMPVIEGSTGRTRSRSL